MKNDLEWLNQSVKLQKAVNDLLEDGLTAPLRYKDVSFILYGKFYESLGYFGTKHHITERVYNLPMELRYFVMDTLTKKFITSKLNGKEYNAVETEEDVFKIMEDNGLRFVPIDLVKRYLKGY